MKYTKRDLELVQILRDNFERWIDKGVAGLCYSVEKIEIDDGLIDMQEHLRISEILDFNFPDTGGIYIWEPYLTEPRKQFLDDLIEKIKNNLSTWPRKQFLNDLIEKIKNSLST